MATLREKISNIVEKMRGAAAHVTTIGSGTVTASELDSYADEIANVIEEDGRRREKEVHWVPLTYFSAACSYCGGTMTTPFATEEDAKAKWDSLPDYCGCCGAKMEHLGYDGPDKKPGNR